MPSSVKNNNIVVCATERTKVFFNLLYTFEVSMQIVKFQNFNCACVYIQKETVSKY